MENLLKKKIVNKQQPIGIFFDTASTFVMECIGRSGMDFVIIDNEHSPIEAESSTDFIRAAENSGMTPLCRVKDSSRPAILKLLDVGAQGLIVPDVRSVAQVKEIISYAKYYPIGNRGFCPSRKDGWGFDQEMNVPETMAYYNEQTLLIPQCETVEALACVEEIASLEGVDGLFIGPFDLSISMGIPGQFDHPDFQAALNRIIKACHEAGKFCMMFAGSEQAVVDGFAMGNDSMAYSIDALHLIEVLRERLGNIKAQL